MNTRTPIMFSVLIRFILISSLLTLQNQSIWAQDAADEKSNLAKCLVWLKERGVSKEDVDLVIIGQAYKKWKKKTLFKKSIGDWKKEHKNEYREVRQHLLGPDYLNLKQSERREKIASLMDILAKVGDDLQLCQSITSQKSLQYIIGKYVHKDQSKCDPILTLLPHNFDNFANNVQVFKEGDRYESVVVKGPLASGSFKTSFHAKSIEGRGNVAVLRLKNPMLKSAREEMENEIANRQQIKSILNQDGSDYFLVGQDDVSFMEPLGVELFDFIVPEQRSSKVEALIKELGFPDSINHLSADEIKVIATDLINQMEAMHDKGLIHRDIKPENIIIFKDQKGQIRAKLIDFSFMITEEEGKIPGLNIKGTIGYLHPESLQSRPIQTRKGDQVAMTTILYLLFFDNVPPWLNDQQMLPFSFNKTPKDYPSNFKLFTQSRDCRSGGVYYEICQKIVGYFK